MTTRVIVLNGASSSGKTTLARALQAVLPDPWLTFGVDTLLTGMPLSGAGIDITPDGEVTVGDAFRALEAAWIAGIAAMVHAGARIVVDEVFLGGGASQRRWLAAFDGLDVLWVGVHCAVEVATARELARGDRIAGMAARQANLVHDGVRYDVEADTSDTDPATCAKAVAARVR
ncbi:chloramphenicol phosphotransferase CPT [Amycolatopsis sp. NBC_01488]|uniref:chloramphenicol phosphotransferase CPT n=1 Tax=Amycolatopsis sp. NBC_01488 TaxID=2903563 RepID=UPI002E2CD6BC|nr:chloramphenicol phosphotransferase CPT [Amycolatopsis sp. NBC_01488]